MQIFLDNVGCRLNWSEVERLAQDARAAGHAVVTNLADADIVIVNTCAVTAQAERKTRHTIRSLHRANPDARLAVVGCYATLRPHISASLPGVSWVIDNEEKERCVGTVTHAKVGRQRLREAEKVQTLRTRAFVKVQDGCDNRCTYCIVRSLRGPSRSRPVRDVVEEIQDLTEQADCREVVLTGASLGAYGRDLELRGGLQTLISAVLADTDVPRLRISSLEPWDIGEAFFELWSDSRVCRQIHLPLQAGCDATLRRMGRPITTTAFARLVEAARDAVPEIAVTTDVLVGFPGEDEEAFSESYTFVRKMAFAKLHVFPYSRRPGTPAAKLPQGVPHQVRDERARRMRELGAEERRRFQTRFLNRELGVLWEKQRQDGRWTGWTDNYIRVVATADGDEACSSLENQITAARLLSVEPGYVKGEVVA